MFLLSCRTRGRPVPLKDTTHKKLSNYLRYLSSSQIFGVTLVDNKLLIDWIDSRHSWLPCVRKQGYCSPGAGNRPAAMRLSADAPDIVPGSMRREP